MKTEDLIFDSHIPFQECMQAVFRHQLENEPVFARFCSRLNGFERPDITPQTVPLLPARAFREATIGDANTPLKFRSSGTTSMQHSWHYVKDPELYRKSILMGINRFHQLDDFSVLAYVPGYDQNPHSSLIWMLNVLIERDGSGLSRFLEPGKPVPKSLLSDIARAGKRPMLFGAAFGLLDLCERFETRLPANGIVLETGGMKTHRREIGRLELHERLATGFGLDTSQIHSEYGMTELLSQAYSTAPGLFQCPHWMQVSIRDPENPMQPMPDGESGLIGIIDLANLHSCSFVLTGDLGVMSPGGFQVLGRYEPEGLRGCNFLIDRDL